MAFAGEPKWVEIVGGLLNYYLEYETTNLPVECVLGANLHTIKLVNDASGDTEIIYAYFDGVTVVAALKPGENTTLNTRSCASVYIRGTAGGSKVRILGW